MSEHDEVFDWLKRATRLAEVPPPGVLRQALDAFAWRGISTALAAVDYDSAIDDDDSARVRAASRDRRLSFRGNLGVLEVSVIDDGQRLVGRVQPARPGEVQLRYPSRTDRAAADGFGHFVFESVEPGPVSFCWQPEDGASGFDTEWVTI